MRPFVLRDEVVNVYHVLCDTRSVFWDTFLLEDETAGRTVIDNTVAFSVSFGIIKLAG